MVNQIRYGFQIIGDEIYDTNIVVYELIKEFVGENLLVSMKENGYKRLLLFEPLLYKYDIDTVFEMLNYNSYLKKQRLSNSLMKKGKLHYISNVSKIYNYPPTFLTQRRFAHYKTCQNLKKRLG